MTHMKQEINWLLMDQMGPVLGGAIQGRAAFVKWLAEFADEPMDPTPLAVDFRKIEFATISFLRESVIALRAHHRQKKSNHYLVLANLKTAVQDEFLALAKLTNDTFICCATSLDHSICDVYLLGDLDGRQKETFDIVQERGEIDAANLLKLSSNAGREIGQTAMNNRLTGLVQKGLVCEVASGRHKKYRPIFSRVTGHGH